MSIELQNFAIYIDKEDFVTDIRISDVSKVFGLKKNALSEYDLW